MNYAETLARGYTVTRGWKGEGPKVAGRLRDHTYQLRRDGRTTWVSEPYGIDEPHLIEEFLEQNPEWEVTIGDCALWYPGSTVPIQFTRKEPRA